MKRKKKKFEYVYLVHCNKNPILYAIYKTKQSAVRYASSLIKYRKEKAKEKDLQFEYFHFNPFLSNTHNYWKDKDPMMAEGIVFSSCLKIKDGLEKEWSDDGCMIYVEARYLR